ncbi:MAG: hypothetical protein AAGU78_16005 [Chloroflexota bacterium]|jgi:hypothetical protein|nr:hypothetical protein [Aggregatilineaceae bacterium]
MTRRPDLFNQANLEQVLREQGCPESFISTAVSNFRLFVPLLFAQLGEDRVFDLLYAAHGDLGLGQQKSAWRSSAKYLVAWAERELELYKTRRGLDGADAERAGESLEKVQPRLL